MTETKTRDQSEKIYNIGVVIGNIYTSYPQELIRGISDAAKNFPINIQFFPGTQSSAFFRGEADVVLKHNFDYQFNTIYDFAVFGDLDAIIISYGTLCIFLNAEEKADFFKKYEHLPWVVMEETVQQENASYFISDNYGGIRQIMEHLIVHHGYRKILYVSGPRENTDAKQRRQAYLDTMKRYGLTATDDMIIYGDFSQYIDDEVEDLLLANPDAEAICCANDDMAVSVYRVCAKLGRMVGRDIAVTGYDNLPRSSAMDPPLTTVDQNGYDIGQKAVMAAWQFCIGNCATENIVSASMVLRESCGCGNSEGKLLLKKQENNSLKELVTVLVDQVLETDILKTTSEEVIRPCRKNLLQIMDYLLEHSIDFADSEKSSTECVAALRKILYQTEKLRDRISLFSLSDVFRELGCLVAEEILSEQYREKYRQLISNLRYIQEYFQNRARYLWEEQRIRSERKTWLSPLFMQYLMEQGHHEKEALEEAIYGMKQLGIKSSFILLLEEPFVFETEEVWKCPDKLYVAAYHMGEEVHSYKKEERPVLTRRNGFGQFFREGCHMLVAFSLFNLQKQYGVLLCEIEEDEIASTYVISIQLGTAL
ncbi:MAG: LacI family transcriptional regulator [Clostridiales bacterium]|nr:LacI family transcriptional regulator [Clostridiales bacterium]